MTKDKEPLPCPLCGEMPHKYEYENERRYSCMNMACPMWNKYLSLEQWNRRSLTATPDGYVRYCHECNHTGLVEPGHLTCCPDSKAVHVPVEVARLARAGFEKLYCEPQHTGSCPLCDQRAELEQTHVLVSRYDLLNLHTDCLTEIRDWAAYVPEWAVEKHDFWGSVKRLDDAYLALIGAAQKEQT